VTGSTSGLYKNSVPLVAKDHLVLWYSLLENTKYVLGIVKLNLSVSYVFPILTYVIDSVETDSRP